MEPSHVPAARSPKRPRKLQNALDTIRLYGGVVGVTGAARELGIKPENIDKQGDWAPQAWTRIDCGRVYLRADVEAAKQRKGKKP